MSDPQLPGYQFCCQIAPRTGSIDGNGHVNIAHFGVMFEEAATVLMKQLGFGQKYKEQQRCAYFVRENHLTVYAEVFEGTPLAIFSRIVNVSDRAFEALMVMVKPDDLSVVSVQDTLWLHVNLDQRRVVPARPDSLMELKHRLTHQKNCLDEYKFHLCISFRKSVDKP